MNVIVTILIILAVSLTLGVLISGLVVMARGGDVNRKWGNKLMRYRVVCQGVALALLAVAFMLG